MTVRCGVLLVLCCGFAFAQTQSLMGSVTSTADSSPIAGAKVTLRADATSLTVLTDASGSFTFGGVPAGNYFLSAERTGYLAEGQQGQFAAVAVASVTAQAKPAPVAMWLTPAATIIGTVTDETGLPLPNANVMLIRRMVTDGRGRLVGINQANANDLGEFRLPGVTAGRYLVCANATASSYLRRHRLTYAPVCYPGVTDPASAQWVKVAPGEERQLAFRMTPAHGVRVSGSLIDAGKSASISVQRTDTAGFPRMFSSAVNWNNKTSSFDILALTPGDYLITAGTNDGDGQTRRAMRAIQVGSEDIGNIRLTPRDGPYLTGTVRMGDAPVRAEGHLNIGCNSDKRMTVYAYSGSGGSFRCVVAEPGAYSVRVLPPTGWYVQAITQGAADIADREIAIDADSDPEPIEIVLAQGGGSVEVSPPSAPGKPDTAVKLTLLRKPASGAEWDEEGRPAYGNGSGATTLRGIRPGEYLLFAWPAVSEVEYLNPEVIDKYHSYGQTVTVRDGETTRVTVTPVPIE